MKTEKIKCPKCRKKVDTEVKEDGELICSICGKSLGFMVETTPFNYFIEMVQVYLDHKGIKGKATINEDGHLDILLNFEKEDQQELAGLLSKCMPISYVITNTAIKKEKDKGVKTISVKRKKTKKQVEKGQTGLESFLL